MQNVPKIVRERLRAAAPAVNHPDADSLTAFAERSLPELERDIVLEHLARCDDCRDVVALSVPESEPLEASALTTRGQWLRRPTIRWAFVAAGIVAVAAVGVVQYQRKRPATMAVYTYLKAPTTEARNETATVPQATEPFAKQERKEAAPAANGDVVNDAGTGAGRLKVSAGAPAVIMPQASHGNAIHSSFGGAIGGPIVHAPGGPLQLQQNQWQQNSNFSFQNQATPPPPTAGAKQGCADAPLESRVTTSAAAPTPSAPSSSQTVTVEVSGAAPQVSLAEVQNQRAAQQSVNDAVNPVGKAKEPVKVETEAATVDAAVDTKAQELPVARNDTTTAGRNLAQIVEVTPMTRWTVTSAGGLQRSFDRGNTWQDVDVNVSANVPGLATSGKTAARTREKDKYLSKKQASGGPVFRAVTTIGADVWAGGSAGALYHSSDGGNQWARVTPSVAGSALTVDVVGLEFSDPQHGTITTSTGERWTTADSGQTWLKQ
jgi:hypothetical protein